MVSRENKITLVFIALALPAGFLTQAILAAVEVSEQTTFTVAYVVILVVGVLVPQVLVRRLERTTE